MMHKPFPRLLYLLFCWVFAGCSLVQQQPVTAPDDWPSQLATVRSVAHEIDPAAVLTFISARSATQGDAPLAHLWFEFVRPDGRLIRVNLTPSSKGFEVTTDLSVSRVHAPSSEEFGQLRQAEQDVLPLLKVGPREALQHTQGHDVGASAPVPPSATVSLGIYPETTARQERHGVPALWVVLHTEENSAGGTSTRAFYIHPADGTLLEEEDAFEDQ